MMRMDKLTTDTMLSTNIKNPRGDFDNPWMHSFNLYFRDFMEICLPQIAAQIDWSKGYELLEKEFNAVTRNAKVTKRLADKLVKIWKINGKETLILCHLEVDIKPSGILPKRMLIYRYRIYDRLQLPIISIAVLIDDSPTWRLDRYRQTCFGTYLEIRYLVVKLLDYQKRRYELEAANNRFALLLLAQLTVLETKKDPLARLKDKTALTRLLYEKGFNKEDIHQLYTLIDWMIALPEELMREYNRSIKKFEKEKKVNYITTAERIGIQKGERRGIQKGERIGIQKGEAAILIQLLRRRFHRIPENYLRRIHQANAETLLKWADRLLNTQSLEDVFN